MRKIIILLVILISISLTAENIIFYPDLIIDSYYNSNILDLSKNDLDRFDSGTEPDKFSIKTTDDLITSAKIELNFKHHFVAGHTQINKIAVKYNKFLKNALEDDLYIQFALKQYLSKKLNFGIYYYFYPEIYVNRYDSVIDQEYIFRDFTYSKNSYIGKVNYQLNSKYKLDYRFSFSQLFYNKYFTEYDAENFENGIGIRIIPKDWIKISAGYIFKISKAKAEDAYSNRQEITMISDGSYRTNIFDLALDFPAIFSLLSKSIDLDLSGKYEKKFYQADNELDEYHYGRADKIITLDAALQSKPWMNISIEYFYKFKFRNTISPYTSVVNAKEYDRFETGVSLSYSL